MTELTDRGHPPSVDWLGIRGFGDDGRSDVRRLEHMCHARRASTRIRNSLEQLYRASGLRSRGARRF